MPSFEQVECYSHSDCIGAEECVEGRCAAPLQNAPENPPETPRADAGVTPPPSPSPDAASPAPDAASTPPITPPAPDAGSPIGAIDCRGRNCDRTRCEEDCTLDCTNGGECNRIECRDGAECLLMCEGAERCSFDDCDDDDREDDGEGGDGRWCEGGILVCNRDCP